MELEIIKTMIEDTQNEIHTSLPAIIKSVDYGAGTCTVEIIPQRVLCGKLTKYPTLIDVKLDFLKFGDWKLQFPRKEGDKVWIGFSESTISEDTSLERFSLNEPYIIGSCEGGYEDNSEDIILTGAGTRIEIKGNGDINIIAGSNKTTITSNVTINGDVTINGNTTQIGDTTQTGTVTINGSIGASGDVTGKGISLNDHTHNYNPGSNPQTSTSKAQ